MNKAATIPLVAALFVAVKSAQTAKHCCDGWRITRGTLDLVFLAMEMGKLDGMDADQQLRAADPELQNEEMKE